MKQLLELHETVCQQNESLLAQVESLKTKTTLLSYQNEMVIFGSVLGLLQLIPILFHAVFLLFHCSLPDHLLCRGSWLLSTSVHFVWHQWLAATATTVNDRFRTASFHHQPCIFNLFPCLVSTCWPPSRVHNIFEMIFLKHNFCLSNAILYILL